MYKQAMELINNLKGKKFDLKIFDQEVDAIETRETIDENIWFLKNTGKEFKVIADWRHLSEQRKKDIIDYLKTIQNG